MDRKSIDQFFDSLSKNVLKEKWNKYNHYSENPNNITIFKLLEVWDIHYENTFVYCKPDLGNTENILKEESGISFGLFLY